MQMCDVDGFFGGTFAVLFFLMYSCHNSERLKPHDVTSLATVASLRQHPPKSPVGCGEAESKM